MMLVSPGAFPLPTIPSNGKCWLFNNAPTTTQGLPLDLFGVYVFDAVFAAASGIADTLTGARSSSIPPPFKNVTSAMIASTLLSGGPVPGSGTAMRPSLLTGIVATWLPNGDRYGVPMSLVNVQGPGTITTVGTWTSAIAPAPYGGNVTGLMPAGVLMSDGSWSFVPPIIWPGNVTTIPPDRAVDNSGASATALVVALIGVIASVLIGSVVKHAGLMVLPESGVSVLVGASFGVLLRFAFGSDVQSTAEFNQGTFLLILLPIIIFESGYALDKRPFFSQLFSIVSLAVFGTIISAAIIGYMVWWAGIAGTIAPISGEEAAAFGSLLSATDPVATLAVFSATRTHPILSTLVYGESVVNDAVAIVLYRSFAGFLVADVTANAVVLAIGAFIAILFFSVLLGLVVGLCATCAFRYVNVTGQDRNVHWEREFRARVQNFNKFIPGTTVSQGEEHKEVVAAVTHLDHDDGTHVTLGNVDLLAGIAETSILLLFGYVSFSFAEAIGLSGIVSALFAGITSNMYTRRVLTRDGKVTTTAVFKMLANLAETTVFFQIGLNVVITLDVGNTRGGFILFTLFSVLLARGVAIFPISHVLNMYRDTPIPASFQIQLWHAGLRGAIAYATALGFPSQNRALVVNATSWICLFSIFVMGGSTPAMLNWMKIPTGVDPDEFWQQHDADEAKARAKDAEMAAKANATRAAALAAAEASGTVTIAVARAAAYLTPGATFHVHAQRQIKDFMAWLDRWIQRAIYGRRFLREMETTNDLASLRARQRTAIEMGLVFPKELEASIHAKESWLANDAINDDEDEDSEDEAVENAEAAAAAVAAGETVAAAKKHRPRNPAVERGAYYYPDEDDRRHLAAMYAAMGEPVKNNAEVADIVTTSSSPNKKSEKVSFSKSEPESKLNNVSVTPVPVHVTERAAVAEIPSFSALHGALRPPIIAQVQDSLPEPVVEEKIAVAKISTPVNSGNNVSSPTDASIGLFTGATPWQGQVRSYDAQSIPGTEKSTAHLLSPAAPGQLSPISSPPSSMQQFDSVEEYKTSGKDEKISLQEEYSVNDEKDESVQEKMEEIMSPLPVSPPHSSGHSPLSHSDVPTQPPVSNVAIVNEASGWGWQAEKEEERDA
jgi:NhaP-type Na+/H+ or K+/H+ antiporter